MSATEVEVRPVSRVRSDAVAPVTSTARTRLSYLAYLCHSPKKEERPPTSVGRHWRDWSREAGCLLDRRPDPRSL